MENWKDVQVDECTRDMCACGAVDVQEASEACGHKENLAPPCDPTTDPSGELSSQLPEKLSLVIGSILGALAFLLLAAITVLAVIFQR